MVQFGHKIIFMALCGAIWSPNASQNRGERNPRSPPCGASLLFFLLYSRTGPRRALSLKLSDTRVYEPEKRTRLGASQTRMGLRLIAPARLRGMERAKGRVRKKER